MVGGKPIREEFLTRFLTCRLKYYIKWVIERSSMVCILLVHGTKQRIHLVTRVRSLFSRDAWAIRHYTLPAFEKRLCDRRASAVSSSQQRLSPVDAELLRTLCNTIWVKGFSASYNIVQRKMTGSCRGWLRGRCFLHFTLSARRVLYGTRRRFCRDHSHVPDRRTCGILPQKEDDWK